MMLIRLKDTANCLGVAVLIASSSIYVLICILLTLLFIFSVILHELFTFANLKHSSYFVHLFVSAVRHLCEAYECLRWHHQQHHSCPFLASSLTQWHISTPAIERKKGIFFSAICINMGVGEKRTRVYTLSSAHFIPLQVWLLN